LKFTYPINVLCFNRPAYLEQLLDSLQSQSVEISQDKLFFWVDGFQGSLDEKLGRPDRTHEVAESIQKFFPESQLRISKHNLGIARNYNRAEVHSFENLKASSAFFLEEDLVLSPLYFELTARIDSFVHLDQDISHISLTGDFSHTASSPENYFQTFGHNWGYLLRSWHHFERKEFLEGYISIISKQPYYLRSINQSQILKYFYSKGVILAGITQDAIKDGLRNYFNRISVTTNEPWASNIGVSGEHFSHATSHHHRTITSDLHSFPPNFDFERKSELLLDGKSKTSSQVYENYLSSLDGLVAERDGLVAERDGLVAERDGLVAERDGLVAERDNVLNSRIWQITKPYRVMRSKRLRCGRSF
jgi:hypothetical protein